jgi:predicted NBD/HSP70 family sugar kinase
MIAQDDSPGSQLLLIGIDVGGTKCAAGLVEFPDGRVLARRLEPTRPERGGEAVLTSVIDLALSLRQEAQDMCRLVAAIGVGLAELIGIDGQILSDATIRWRGMAVDERIRSATELPATLEADVRAAARAEAKLGAGRPFRSFLYVTVGTGISAAHVVEGVPYAGASGLTGTFASSRGMIPCDRGGLAVGPPLEQFAAGPALAARLAAERAGFAGTAFDVMSLASAGDDLPLEIVNSAGEALGAAVGQLVNVLDPEAVVVGGGLGLTEGPYRIALDRGLRQHIWSDLHRSVPLLSAEMGNDAGFVGAAIAAACKE